MRFLLAFSLLIVLLCPAPARAAILDIQEIVSHGGIKAWLVEDHSVPVITLRFGFRGAGALRDPDDRQGLALMLSNTMDEGAGDLDAQSFQRQLDNLSITLRYASSRDDFTGMLKTLTANRDKALELLALSLHQPRFDAEAVDRMRAANQSRIRSALSDPDWIAARLLNDAAFAGHPYARNSGGTLSSLAAITPDDLRSFHKTMLGRNNLYVGLAGDITTEEAKALLDKVFGALPVLDLPPAPAQASIQNTDPPSVYRMAIPQTVIQIMQPGMPRHDSDFYAAQVMNFILGASGFGSRLMHEVREKRGLTYGIYTSLMHLDHFDGLMLGTSTRNDKVPEMLGLIAQEWDRMKTEAVGAQELADAKSYLIGAMPLSYTSTDDIAAALLSLQMNDLPIDQLDRERAGIEKATAADIQRVARRILDTTKMTTVLVGDPAGIEKSRLIERLPNVE